jgi:pyridoxamine 5'-phosphate oxidase
MPIQEVVRLPKAFPVRNIAEKNCTEGAPAQFRRATLNRHGAAPGAAECALPILPHPFLPHPFAAAAPNPTMPSIADLRKDYERAELDEASALGNPQQQFALWLQQAIDAQLPEPTAMTLASVGANGRPSTRVVLLKGNDEHGLVWFSNYESRKGRELAANPFAALQFHWVELERVVRIEGRVEHTDAAESDAYFQSRPLDSRIGAWASPQSQVISSRAVLVANAAKFGAKYLMNPPRPPHWGGFRLMPDRWEFWQGRRSRLHDRLVYRFDAGTWLRERLAP